MNVNEKKHPWKMGRSVLGGLSKNRGDRIAWQLSNGSPHDFILNNLNDFILMNQQ